MGTIFSIAYISPPLNSTTGSIPEERLYNSSTAHRI
jgi:hypothetical protein